MPPVMSVLRQIALASTFLFLTTAAAAWAQVPSPAGKATAAKLQVQPSRKRPVVITISKETTRITEPLRKDGYVDYVAALDQRFHTGVTPENNASVLFWQAMGPRGIIPRHRDEYFKRLGIPPLPEKGNYYVSLAEYFQRRREGGKPADAALDLDWWEQLTAAMSRPWSRKEFPLLADWLAANEKPLSIVIEASKRPRRYYPLIAEAGNMVIDVLLPAVDQQREAAKALKARAMIRLSECEVDQAWDDLLACHRLARLTAQGPTLVDALFATAIDRIACAGDQALVEHSRLTAAEVGKLQNDLGKLPPLPKIVEKIDVGERYLFLDCVSTVARDGLASMDKLGRLTLGETASSTVTSLMKLVAGATIDWDRTLRMGNAWYDRMADAYRQPTRSERRESLHKIEADLRKLEEKVKKHEIPSLIAASRPA